jgi:hypothetical protein
MYDILSKYITVTKGARIHPMGSPISIGFALFIIDWPSWQLNQISRGYIQYNLGGNFTVTILPSLTGTGLQYHQKLHRMTRGFDKIVGN